MTKQKEYLLNRLHNADKIQKDNYITYFMDYISTKMCSVFRYTSIPTIRQESIAQHSYEVAVLAGAIARKLKDNYEIDATHVYELALLHDVQEIYASDIPAPFKIQNPEFTKEYNSCIEKFMFAKIKEMTDPLFRLYFAIANEETSSIESIIVKIADSLQLINYAAREADMGNTYMTQVIGNAKAILDSTVEGLEDRALARDLDMILKDCITDKR